MPVDCPHEEDFHVLLDDQDQVLGRLCTDCLIRYYTRITAAKEA